MFRQCTRYVLLAAILLAPIGYIVNGPGFAALVVVLLIVFIYQIPFLIWMNIQAACKSGVRCWANSRGMQINRRFYLWSQVEEYNFSNSTLSASVTNLNIKTRQSKVWRSLSFSQSDVDEQELKTLLERFVSQSVPGQYQ